MAMQKVSIEEATAEQMWRFAELSGIELPKDLTIENAKPEPLKTILGAAGIKMVFFEDKPDLNVVQVGGFEHVLPDDNPSGRERWMMFQLLPDPRGENSLAPIYVSVNQMSAWVPVGVLVVMRETLYNALNVMEHRTPSTEHAYGRNSKVSTAKAVPQTRHPHNSYGAVGFVDEGVPEIVKQRDDIYPIADGTTEMGSIARKRQKALEALMTGTSQAA